MKAVLIDARGYEHYDLVKGTACYDLVEGTACKVGQSHDPRLYKVRFPPGLILHMYPHRFKLIETEEDYETSFEKEDVDE